MQMDGLKHRIRRELWRGLHIKGGFLHAPDSQAEAHSHRAILQRRIIRQRSISKEHILLNYRPESGMR
ncbi:hypothetical protein [Dongshaea marina]|uniref:hypothetical protein n=1 Tax=Dongshaea marina TaxID=2047966 RepID=UPI00131EFA3A|nr:hypothetical protein [Dongshaea marina]